MKEHRLRIISGPAWTNDMLSTLTRDGAWANHDGVYRTVSCRGPQHLEATVVYLEAHGYEVERV